jgi:hypothetical protein
MARQVKSSNHRGLERACQSSLSLPYITKSLASHGRMSSQTTGAVLLLFGIVAGAGLIFGTLYATGSLAQRTTTETTTVFVSTTQYLTTTLTLTTTVTSSGVTVSSAQLSAQVTQCEAGTGTAANNNQCTVVLTNTGTANVAVTGGNEQIGGVTVACNPAPSGTVPASGSLSVTCLQASPTPAQTVGSQAIGSFTFSNGASVPFSGVWS